LWIGTTEHFPFGAHAGFVRIHTGVDLTQSTLEDEHFEKPAGYHDRHRDRLSVDHP
jgi:hypothetical protein